MNRHGKYVEKNIPKLFGEDWKNFYRLRVVHLHSGNCSRSKRNGKEMKTIATFEKPSHKIGERQEHFRDWQVVARGSAACSKRDCANRKVGRQVAVGRAMLDLEDKLSSNEGNF